MLMTYSKLHISKVYTQMEADLKFEFYRFKHKTLPQFI